MGKLGERISLPALLCPLQFATLKERTSLCGRLILHQEARTLFLGNLKGRDNIPFGALSFLITPHLCCKMQICLRNPETSKRNVKT